MSETTPIQVRFPADVLAGLREQAAQHERSFNGEVIWALREYLKERPAPVREEARKGEKG